jgi:hypothetical protein
MSLGVTTNPITNPNFTTNTDFTPAITLKLLKGEALSPAEIKILQSTLKKNTHQELTTEDIRKLQQYLTIQGDGENDEPNNTYDLRPFGPATSDASLAIKRKNFSLELEKFDARMKEIFGNNYPGSAEITRLKEASDLAQLSTKNTGQITDSFTQALEAKLTDPKTTTDTKFNGLDDNALQILAMGTLMSLDISSIGNAGQTPDTLAINTKIDGIRQISMHDTHLDWIQNLDNLMSSVTPADKIVIEPLKNKLLNLEELQESDKDTLRYFLSLKKMNVNDSVVENAFRSFNDMIASTRLLNPQDTDTIKDIELKASLIAHQANIDTILPSQIASPKLTEALRLLNQNPPNYNTQNQGIKAAEFLFKDHLNNLTPQEKPLVLRNLLNKLLKREQEKRADDDLTHHSKIDTGSLYNEFKDQVFTLETFINKSSLGESHRRALIADMCKYIRGEEASQELQTAFAGSGKEDLRKALDYFSKSYGDPNTNSGILELICNNADNAIDFNALVQKSQNFDELAAGLRVSILQAKAGGRDALVPNSLVQRPTAEVMYSLSDLANLKQTFTTDKDGVKTPVDDYAIFNQLKFDTSTKFTVPKKDSKGDLIEADCEKLADEVKQSSERLYELLLILTGSHLQVGKHMALCLESADSEGKGGIPNNGRKLAELLEKQISTTIKHITDYEGYEEGKTQFSYSELMETREKLIDFSKKYNTGFFTTDKIVPVLATNEYKDILLNFAMVSRDLDKLIKSNHSIYQTPSGIKVDFSYKDTSTPATTPATTPAPTTATASNYSDYSSYAYTNASFDSWLDNLFKNSYSASEAYFTDEDEEEQEEDIFKKIMSVASNGTYVNPFADIRSNQNIDFFA